MEFTKQRFKDQIKSLRKLKETGDLTEYGSGKLKMAEWVENLILSDVSTSF